MGQRLLTHFHKKELQLFSFYDPLWFFLQRLFGASDHLVLIKVIVDHLYQYLTKKERPKLSLSLLNGI